MDEAELSRMGLELPVLDAAPPPRYATRPKPEARRSWKGLVALAVVALLATGVGAVALRPSWRALTEEAPGGAEASAASRSRRVR